MHSSSDVAHNIAKVWERYPDGEWLVHRKGATRAFGPGNTPELPNCYRAIGQPVICGGSMKQVPIFWSERIAPRKTPSVPRCTGQAGPCRAPRPNAPSQGDQLQRDMKQRRGILVQSRLHVRPGRRSRILPTKTFPTWSRPWTARESQKGGGTETPIGNIKGWIFYTRAARDL